jgi:hypothetical protein
MQALATSPVGGSGLKILFDLFGQERCRALISGTGSKAKRPEAEGLWSVTDTVTYYTRGCRPFSRALQGMEREAQDQFISKARLFLPLSSAEIFQPCMTRLAGKSIRSGGNTKASDLVLRQLVTTRQTAGQSQYTSRK